MNAAYALMVRTYAGIPGKSLLDAIELTNESFGMERPPEVQEAAVEVSNQASLEQLTGMLKGVVK